ncbi:MAG: hypothetical protein RL161_419 [Bacteroidota bacterium]|jgi:hypothetical protein
MMEIITGFQLDTMYIKNDCLCYTNDVKEDFMFDFQINVTCKKFH